MEPRRTFRLGATPTGGAVEFAVWAPTPTRVELRTRPAGAGGEERGVAMERDGDGYWLARVEDDGTGGALRYGYSLDGGPVRPDPASRSQPEGVHAWSEVVDAGALRWSTPTWAAPSLSRYVIYELHIGTFTETGTFDAAIERLDSLSELGVTAVEVMPIAEFPGGRNWGYDGVCPFAAQSTYGGPSGFSRFVDACHRRGLAVVLDVVYNHVGPEGNYLREFGPYFTDAYKTPWGAALNFDGPDSDHVRRLFIESALWWVEGLRVDGLRLDAVHSIVDASATPFVQEACGAVHRRAEELGRRAPLIAESAANDARLARPVECGGVGADAQWNDDFHHALHAALTGERAGYYASYGGVSLLRKAVTDGFVYTGERSAFHRRRFGTPSRSMPGERFVVFSQNHDQIGNRARGERVSALVGFDGAKVAAAATLLSPFVPLLFMGEEHMETAPFLYFVSHSDEALVEAVRRGRAAEFAECGQADAAYDPQGEDAFARSRIDHRLRERGEHAAMLAWYTALLRLRRERPALASLDKWSLEAGCDEERATLWVRRWSETDEVFAAFNLGEGAAEVAPPTGAWVLLLHSFEGRFLGGRTPPGEPPPSVVSRRLDRRAAGGGLTIGGRGVAVYAKGGD